MITKFFTNKDKTVKAHNGGSKYGADDYVLRPHAREKFWSWLASWARAARLPADLGFDNDGFMLAPLIENDIKVNGGKDPEHLFAMTATNWHEERAAIRRTIRSRCEMAAQRIGEINGISIAWCHLNDEGDMLEEIIPGAVQIAGKHSDEEKEEKLKWFVKSTDSHRVLISKPDILGFGMNFQFADHSTYFPTHSYERYYQATRRGHRFGRTGSFIVDRIYTKGTERMLENMARKARQADEMFTELVRYMHEGLNLKRTYTHKELEVPQWMSK